jgi:hypothetical protein
MPFVPPVAWRDRLGVVFQAGMGVSSGLRDYVTIDAGGAGMTRDRSMIAGDDDDDDDDDDGVEEKLSFPQLLIMKIMTILTMMTMPFMAGGVTGSVAKSDAASARANSAPGVASLQSSGKQRFAISTVSHRLKMLLSAGRLPWWPGQGQEEQRGPLRQRQRPPQLPPGQDPDHQLRQGGGSEASGVVPGHQRESVCRLRQG